jgi:hypothetical protein
MPFFSNFVRENQGNLEPANRGSFGFRDNYPFFVLSGKVYYER